ncbi:unnamed protein product [Acanthosepion pharaonis]|uniref:Uncharacterized protein n=1 Tax=Acanthosepion pharaonis TaxID=158019 RepID=A0A812ES04_ACAPH|nr:unnamed protein product [Sepia pharaonis]
MSGLKDSLDFWLLKCKNHIVSSQEWKEFLTDLQEKVQQLQFKSHVSCFVDLSRPEKVLLIEQAAKNVDQRFFCALHHQISATIKPILNDYATVTSTKENFVISDIIIDLIYDWVSSILKKWPHLKNKLGIFFNQPLQEKLRQLTWSCFLCTDQAFSNNPKPDENFKPSKQLENEIARNCKQILHEINMKSLNNSTSAFKAMRAMVFSYCSASGDTSLAIEDFLLTIPFLLSMSPFPGELSKKTLTVLVEEYLGFMVNRPSFMLKSNKDFKMFVEMILQLLTQKYPTTAQTFSDVLGCSGSETEITDSLTEKFMILLKPVIQGMLVVPGLSGHWLRVVIVISLHFLKNYVHMETSDISSMFLEKWPQIRMSEIQYEVQKSFQQDFQNVYDGLHLPTCDSSSDVGWFSYSLVPPSPPKLKRANEEKQNLEKKRYVQELLQKKEDETKKQIQNIRKI